ncbi:MAG: nitroreductase [Desulfobacteraceae bacterium 4572_130]|nr:MAG: nitroreductase [Desulfobacteraceae bacterium 4572_130]
MENISLYDLIKKNRSCRRFNESFKIKEEILKSLINLARLSASASNLQPLKYIVSINQKKNENIFSCLKWAAHLKDWKGPENGEKPSAYIVILGDKTITKNFMCDHGIAAQSILLGAREIGLAGCMLAAINHKKLRDFLNIDNTFDILLVIALGKPVEQVKITKLDKDTKYWRDENNVHYVPKRDLNDIIISCS